MNIQRFTAATSREALAKARMAFGDGTLILSNRPIENGVEVVATGEDSLAALDQDSFGGQQQQPHDPAEKRPPPFRRTQQRTHHAEIQPRQNIVGRVIVIDLRAPVLRGHRQMPPQNPHRRPRRDRERH